MECRFCSGFVVPVIAVISHGIFLYLRNFGGNAARSNDCGYRVGGLVVRYNFRAVFACAQAIRLYMIAQNLTEVPSTDPPLALPLLKPGH
ncbi:hypothetical protein KCP75_02665 [Salmonella enterica subsp. enterica]|nr:hypothetical protein KCP75_02665 [Salmonella enterica subsp. enterica]